MEFHVKLHFSSSHFLSNIIIFSSHKKNEKYISQSDKQMAQCMEDFNCPTENTH